MKQMFVQKLYNFEAWWVLRFTKSTSRVLLALYSIERTNQID